MFRHSVTTSLTDAAGHSYQIGYDSQGNPTTYTDTLGHTNQFAYGALNQPTDLLNANGNLTRVIGVLESED